jgi:hypothetical protein
LVYLSNLVVSKFIYYTLCYILLIVITAIHSHSCLVNL